MKNLIVALFALVAFASCTGNKSYKVSGTVDGLTEGNVFLKTLEEGRLVNLDTAVISAEGAFSFEGASDLPEFRILMLDRNQVISQFFIENSDITVTAYKDSLDQTVITGSKSQETFKVFLDELKRIQGNIKTLGEEYRKAQMSGDQNKLAEAKANYEATVENMNLFSKNFVKENAESTVSPFLVMVQMQQTLSVEEIDELIALWEPKLAESKYVKEIKKSIEDKRATAVGAIAPDFTQNDVDGNPVTLSSFRGKYLLIDFWASWCGPCRKENPNVVKLYEQFNAKGFEILGVSLDKDKAAWTKAIADDKLTWTQVSDIKGWKNAVAQQYKVTSIPHTVLLDKDGKIIATNLRGEELEQKLAELLN